MWFFGISNIIYQFTNFYFFREYVPMVKNCLQYPVQYVLVKLHQTNTPQLEGLSANVIPISPISKSFNINIRSERMTVTCTQLPITICINQLLRSRSRDWSSCCWYRNTTTWMIDTVPFLCSLVKLGAHQIVMWLWWKTTSVRIFATGRWTVEPAKHKDAIYIQHGWIKENAAFMQVKWLTENLHIILNEAKQRPKNDSERTCMRSTKTFICNECIIQISLSFLFLDLEWRFSSYWPQSNIWHT